MRLTFMGGLIQCRFLITAHGDVTQVSGVPTGFSGGVLYRLTINKTDFSKL